MQSCQFFTSVFVLILTVSRMVMNLGQGLNLKYKQQRWDLCEEFVGLHFMSVQQ